MLSDAIKKHPHELTCTCGHKIKKTLGWFNDHKTFPCPACNVTVRVNSDELAQVIKAIDKAQADIRGTIDKINKSFKMGR